MTVDAAGRGLQSAKKNMHQNKFFTILQYTPVSTKFSTTNMSQLNKTEVKTEVHWTKLKPWWSETERQLKAGPLRGKICILNLTNL
jgi:hypothetical protein